MSATPCCFAARSTCRPMRPNPLMPTRIAIEISLHLAAIAVGGRSCEGHITENARPALVQRRSTRVQRGCGGHDVVDENDVRATQNSTARAGCAEGARNVSH